MEQAVVQAIDEGIARWGAHEKVLRAEQTTRRLAAINELVQRIETSETVESACQRLADEMATHIRGLLQIASASENGERDHEGELVTVYVASSNDDEAIRLRAISECDLLPADMPEAESVESAMRECLSRQRVSSWPPESNDRHAMLCHRQLVQQLGKSHLLTAPLRDGEGNLQGVVLVASEFALGDDIRVWVAGATEPVASSFRLIQKSQPTPLQRGWEHVSEWFTTGRTRTILKVMAGVIGVGLIPLPYRVGCDCEIRPAVKQFVARYPFPATCSYPSSGKTCRSNYNPLCQRIGQAFREENDSAVFSQSGQYKNHWNAHRW